MASTAYAISTRSGSPNTRRRGRPSVEAVRTTDAAILSASLEVFAAKGFEGASFAEIARKAGVTRHTVYARYPNKAALLSETVTNLINERMRLREVDPGATAQQTLMNIASDLIGSPSAPLLMRIIIAEGASFMHGDTPLARAGRDHLLELLSGVMSNLMQRGLLAKANPREAATLFTDMVIASGSLSTLIKGNEATVEEILTPRVNFFCSGFDGWARVSDPFNF